MVSCALLCGVDADAGYSYSVRINKHEIAVTVQSKDSFSLNVDGKVYRSKEKPMPDAPRSQPKVYSAAAHLNNMAVVLMTAGPALYVNTAKSKKDDDHEVSIDATRVSSPPPSTRGMRSKVVDGKRVFYDTSRLEGGADCCFFVYYLKTEDYLYSISQVVYSKDYPKPVPEPFRSALKTFKVRKSR